MAAVLRNHSCQPRDSTVTQTEGSAMKQVLPVAAYTWLASTLKGSGIPRAFQPGGYWVATQKWLTQQACL